MKLLEMSVSAGVLILLIACFCRNRFWKLSKRTVMLLWMVVLARLLLPGSLPMQKGIAAPVFGLLRQIYTLRPAVTEHTGCRSSAARAPEAASSGQASPLGAQLLQVAGWIWLAGMCIAGAYFIYSYWKEYRLLAQALALESAAQIRECCRTASRLAGMHMRGKTVRILVHDQIRSPLVFGMIRQSIVIPKSLLSLEQTQMQHILTHEMVHIRRHDNLWKLFSTMAVCIHWFNPAVWLMYLLFARDLELSCDERVLAAYGRQGRQEYAMTLLTLATNQKGTTLFCSGFLENPVKERIVAIMKYKRLTGTGILCAGMLLLGATSVFATNGQTAGTASDEEQVNVYLDDTEDKENKEEKTRKVGTAKINHADADSILLEINTENATDAKDKVLVTFNQPVNGETDLASGKIYNYHVDDDGNYVLEALDDDQTHANTTGDLPKTDDIVTDTPVSTELPASLNENQREDTDADAPVNAAVSENTNALVNMNIAD